MIFTICYFSDINECMTPGHNCHDDAICSNTKGSWNCSCNQGYEGNGIHCEGIGLNFICLFSHCEIQNKIRFRLVVYGVNTDTYSLKILLLTCFTQFSEAYSQHSRTTFSR